MWDLPEIPPIESITVALVEDNGRRRVAAVLKHGTEDEWIDIVQKR